MTVWLFYKVDENIKNKKVLYAFTNNKKYAEEFKKQRSKRFLCEKWTKVTDDEYNNFEIAHTKLKIYYGQFYTRSEVFGKKVPVKVLCTFQEEESVVIGSDKLWEEFDRFLFDPKIFKNEYLKALETLLFIKFYGFYKIQFIEDAGSFYAPYYDSYGPVEGLIVDDFKTSFSYDELRVFLRFYKNLFPGGDNIDNEEDTAFEF